MSAVLAFAFQPLERTPIEYWLSVWTTSGLSRSAASSTATPTDGRGRWIGRGWLCDAPTNPAVAEIRLNPDGQVWLRLSDEGALGPLCPFPELLDQIRIVCESVGMTEGQMRATVAWVGEKLG